MNPPTFRTFNYDRDTLKKGVPHLNDNSLIDGAGGWMMNFSQAANCA